MLTATNLSKSFGGEILFEDASLQVNRGDRIGLIGANGAGKSTLFSLILKEASPDSGSIAMERNVKLGFLPQENATSGDETILELACSISPEMEKAYTLFRNHPEEEDPLHHEAQELFAENNGYALEAKAKKILSGLAFRESDFYRMARTMSGGWIMRAHLARLLVMEPDLLMLDEPTNHLDLESLGWFQNHLLNYTGAILAISHDREFLNAICESMIQIRHHKLHHYRGNYDSFLEQKAARDEQHLAAYKSQQREIAELQRFIDRFRAKASKASQAQDRIKQLARMKRIEPPERSEATVHFRFPQPPRSGQRVARLTNVKQAYGDHVVYHDLNLEVERGALTVLVGPNGAGKSTLLKILAEMVPLAAGSYEKGHNTLIGYFAQHRTETMNLKHTVLQEAMSIPKPIPEQMARTILGSFLFSGEDVFKPVSVLSGGEKSRLALVKLLLDPPNFLLLDEPTTHLDMPSIDALIGALKQYEGTLFFVSHDVHFIKALATSVLHINAGKVTPYAGDYNYYLEKSGALSAKAALVAPGNGQPLSNHQPQQRAATSSAAPKMGLKEIKALRKAEAEKRKAANKERRDLEKEIAELETEVLFLESEKKRLEASLEDSSSHATRNTFQLNRELVAILEKLEKKSCRWDQLTTAFAEKYPEQKEEA
ncbi:MAG: ATP-binding cassette domain-containing protein [Chthoniobacterales bacterium]|nr:ATP-binding cassette domain-containing protein [Chthoniobacterales bacterium]